MRVFIAVPVPDEVRHRLAHILDSRLTDAVPGKVVPPPKWHVTLRFLGEIDQVTHERVIAALDEADLGSRFTVRWDGLGAFPKARRATVLWLAPGRGGGEGLGALAAGVEQALEMAGIEPEDRPFHPHLTLSRIRPPRDVSALVEGTPGLGVDMPVDSVVVFQSRLGRGGPDYLELERIELG